MRLPLFAGRSGIEVTLRTGLICLRLGLLSLRELLCGLEFKGLIRRLLVIVAVIGLRLGNGSGSGSGEGLLGAGWMSLRGRQRV